MELPPPNEILISLEASRFLITNNLGDFNLILHFEISHIQHLWWSHKFPLV